MLICLYAAKGGSGTTVVSAALAVEAADRHPGYSVTLVDLAGDMPGVLGVESGPGISEWLAAGNEVPITALARIAVPVSPRLELMRTGSGPGSGDRDRGRVLIELLADRASSGLVIVDCGVISRRDQRDAMSEVAGDLLDRAGERILITRPCYLSLSRASRSPIVPTGVVLVDEPGRALRSADIERVVSSRVVALVHVDPVVARAVDCGLFARRAPRSLRRSVAPLLATAATR